MRPKRLWFVYGCTISPTHDRVHLLQAWAWTVESGDALREVEVELAKTHTGWRSQLAVICAADFSEREERVRGEKK